MSQENYINIQNMMTPLAIVIAGVVIASGLYLGLKDNNTTTGNTTKTQVAGVEDTTPTAAAAGTTVTASIDDDAIFGSKDAKVAIIEFSDYDCPYCEKFYAETLSQIKTNYVETGDVMFVYRDLPLPQLHPNAQMKAEAAECADDQGGDEAYIAYHNGLFNNGSITTEDGLVSLAKQQGLNESEFKNCLSSGKMTSEVEKDAQDANASGLSGTPGFVVGTIDSKGVVTGEKIAGAYPYATFQQALEKYLNQ